MLVATFYLDEVKFASRPHLVLLFIKIFDVFNLGFSFSSWVWFWQINKQITGNYHGGYDTIFLDLRRQIFEQPGRLLRCSKVVDLYVTLF